MKALWDMTQACMEAVQPGREIGAIYAAYEGAMDKLKVKAVRAQFGRIGHGIGVDQCEPPSIHTRNRLLMKPGMALCIEPNFYLPGVGSFIGEEQVIVTERGYELISARAKRGIVRVG